MKKVFISQPMGGRSDMDIKIARERAVRSIHRLVGEDVEIVGSYFKGIPHDVSPLWVLGLDLVFLSMADAAYFVTGWESSRGCRVEHKAALEYGIDVIRE